MATMQLLREEPEPPSIEADRAREAQRAWARTNLRDRLAIVRRVRHRVVEGALPLAQAVPLAQPGALRRTLADTLIAEVLPLVEACRYLEREAGSILVPQRLSSHSRPFWLRGVTVETHRDPLGLVLIIAPANYPLLLPGVQSLQALAAGNAVLWKPAPGGAAAACALREILLASGLEPALLQVLDPSPEAASAAISAGVDKVFLTGSSATGDAVRRQLADHGTPSVMELSGCDAVIVLPDADIERTVDALVFGLRFNGSATCMAPRRVFLVDGDSRRGADFSVRLLDKLRRLPAVLLPDRTQSLLASLMEDAKRQGGAVLLDHDKGLLRYAIVTHAAPAMRITQTDIFAPVLSIFQMPDVESALAAYEQCPYALTASVFGPPSRALALASRITAGVVLINDLIVSTADPRIPIGGRKSSGNGVTRGREGLLEMTALKTILVQRSRDCRVYRPATVEHEDFFRGYLKAAHGGSFKLRMQGLLQFFRAAAKLK